MGLSRDDVKLALLDFVTQYGRACRPAQLGPNIPLGYWGALSGSLAAYVGVSTYAALGAGTKVLGRGGLHEPRPAAEVPAVSRG